MKSLLRPALVASLLVGMLAALSACEEGRAGTQDSDRKKNDRRIYAGIEATIAAADGAGLAFAMPAFGGASVDPRG
jgi:hypothetical protein